MPLKTISITLIVLAALLLGCKEEESACQFCPDCTTDYEEIQNVKHFFSFKVGSWWVYEEENSGDRDSVYVTSHADSPANFGFETIVYSTSQGYYYRFWPEYNIVSNHCPESGAACMQCVNVQRSKYKPGDFAGEATCFIFTPKVGVFEGNFNPYFSNNIVRIESIEDSLQIGNHLFSRTITLFEDNSVMEGLQPTRHFYSEHAGLVRKELLDSNQVWNLVDYYIEP